ncbi:hypothetical protein ACWKTL_27935 [Bacillus toyonensis]|uniref:hypothetical protein n=1 Tax=Bacillus toyonensis TaxID=155322 RepID=UPI000B43B246|nr:hypothetical protein [Bacillus toyonensis]MED3201385.1 hypothetical protein [Bacillus toyonensis]OTX13970.1 hypothetical protein BK712_01095 [Bacillus thuringiensis serovar seoulensis]
MGEQPIVLLKGRTDTFNSMPLEETLKWIEKISCHMASEIDLLKKYESEHVEVIGELLNAETINRFKGLALSLKFPYGNYKCHSDAGTQKMLEQGLLVQSWSSLGSLLESTLQMFLALYYRFYIKSEWYKWEEEAINQITDVLTGSFKENLEAIVKQNEVGGEKGLTNTIKKSFIIKVKEILKQKSSLPKIERITLSDLIDFYFSENVLGSNDYGKEDLQKIRDYRNAIHAFQKRVIGSWDDYNIYLKDVIMLTIDILYRLPDIPDEEPIPDWYYKGKTEIIMQEKVWFDYRLGVNIE